MLKFSSINTIYVEMIFTYYSFCFTMSVVLTKKLCRLIITITLLPKQYILLYIYDV